MKNIILINLLALISMTSYAQGSLLADWIKVQLKLVQKTSGIPHVAYSRHFSYTSIAFYEAATAGEKKYKSLAGQLQGLNKIPDSNKITSQFVAANAAYAEMLRYFYKDNSNFYLIDSIERVNRKYADNQSSADSNSTSSEFGKDVAKAIIQWAEMDGAEKALESYIPPKGDGLWQPTPPSFTPAAAPFWKNNRCLVSGSSVGVIINNPPIYSTKNNSDFYKMVKDLYDVSRELTTEQKEIAWFWDDSPPKYLSVFGHWASILSQIIVNQNLSLQKSAEAFASMAISLQDASIAAWHGKYTFNLLRPITYIQSNIEPNWTPLISTPPHPEFPAAHATLSAAAAMGLARVFGDKLNFSDNSYRAQGMKTRSFRSFSEAATEAGYSRLYGGIHFRSSIIESLEIGKRVSQNIAKRISFE